MDKQYDIIIIDSGVDSKHPWLEAFTVEGITISMNNNDLIVTPGTTDFLWAWNGCLLPSSKSRS